MKKTIFIPLLILNVCICKAQKVKYFETHMLSEKLSQCELLSKYFENIQHYEYYVMDSNYYGITAEGNFSDFSGNYNFAVRNDSLCQFYFMSVLPKKSTSFKSISVKIDSLIGAWTIKYGSPDQLIDDRKDFEDPKVINAYTLLKASWQIKKDKLNLTLSYIDAPNDARGNFRILIHRFRECYFDKKFFPLWKDL